MKEQDDTNPNADIFRRGGSRSAPGPEGPQCLPMLDWMLVAEGRLDARREQEALAHAADCDRCGALLSEAVRLAAPLDQQEQRMIATLPSSPAGAVPNLVPGVRRPPFVPSILAAAASILVLAGISWLYFRGQERGQVSETTAQFSRMRSIEFRLTGSPYEPYRGRTAGPATPGAGDTDDLDAAMARLDEAARSRPATAALLNDRAAIHAARGHHFRLDAEYEVALRLLNQALDVDPSHVEALFNKALVLHHLGRRQEMAEVVSRFLQVEKNEKWRAEAEALLNTP